PRPRAEPEPPGARRAPAPPPMRAPGPEGAGQAEQPPPRAARFADPGLGRVVPQIPPLRAAAGAVLVAHRADAVDVRRAAVGRRERLAAVRADRARRSFGLERLHRRIVPAGGRGSAGAASGENPAPHGAAPQARAAND